MAHNMIKMLLINQHMEVIMSCINRHKRVNVSAQHVQLEASKYDQHV